jgi:hypothetical protein
VISRVKMELVLLYTLMIYSLHHQRLMWCDEWRITHIYTQKVWCQSPVLWPSADHSGKVPLIACFPWRSTLGQDTGALTVYSMDMNIWLYHSTQQPLMMETEILQIGGYYPHFHTDNCLRRLHCSHGESFKSYVLTSPTYQTSNFRELTLPCIILMPWQGIK